MVERTGTGKFRLGLRLFDFGNRAIEQYDLRERAQPHLRRLVAETEETAHLCVLEAARVIYIDKIEPARSVRMITRDRSQQSGALHLGGQGDSGISARRADQRRDPPNPL